MNEESLAIVRGQAREAAANDIERLKVVLTKRQRVQSDEFWENYLTEKVEELLPFAIEVCAEADGMVPLTETQMTTVHLRASMDKARRATQQIEDRLGSLSPARRRVAEAMVPLFKRQNARMEPGAQDASTITEEGLRQLAQQFADELQQTTVDLYVEQPPLPPQSDPE